jgi:hypothetical protein
VKSKGGWLAALLILPLAATAGGNTADQDDALKSLEDPTILKRRVWIDTEWSRFKDSSDDLEFTMGGLWAWPVSENQDWAVRAKVPVKFHRAGDAAGDTDKGGPGDIKLAVGTAFRLSPSLRTAIGLEMRFPTASDNLGSNAWRPQLFGTVAWDVTRAMTFSPSFEYNKSIEELHGSAPQRFVELFFPVTFLLPERWSVTPRYEYKVDFSNNDQVTRSAKLTVAKLLENQFGFALSIKKNIDETSKRFQVNFVTTYYFH